MVVSIDAEFRKSHNYGQNCGWMETFDDKSKNNESSDIKIPIHNKPKTFEEKTSNLDQINIQKASKSKKNEQCKPQIDINNQNKLSTDVDENNPEVKAQSGRRAACCRALTESAGIRLFS